MVLALQATQTTLERVAERWGLPVVILVLVGLTLRYLFKTYVGPYIQTRMARADAKEDQVHSLLTEQLKYEREQAQAERLKAIEERQKVEARTEKSERAQETLLKDFRGAIEENNRVSRRVADSLDELLKRK